MNSGKKTPELIALENTRMKKIIILSESMNLDIDENVDFITSFNKKIKVTLKPEKTLKHIEALEFIIQNKPKDILECYHLLHLFLLDEITHNMFFFMDKSTIISHLQEFARLTIKATTSYSGGMIALKTYRSGVNITKNIQNNTLNQQNNFTSKAPVKPKEIDEKGEIKNVAKSKRKVKV